MWHKKFNLIAQVVGYAVIGLLAIYGFVNLLGSGPAWAASGFLQPTPAAPQAAQALAPTTLGYVGYLKDDAGNPLNNVYTMTFRIYADASTPTPLWEETQTNISVSGGVFNVVLGATTPFPADLFANPDRYLGITIDGYPGELLPRQQFASVPYSLRTERASGLAAADGDPTDAAVVDNAGNVTFSGNVGIGTTSPTAELDVRGLRISLKEDSSGDLITLGTWGDALNINFNDNLWLDGGGSSEIYLNPFGGNVGIGTASPSAELDVRGSRISLKEDSSGDAITLGTWGDALDINFNDHLFLQGSSGSQIYLNPNGGNVGVGTSSPTATLDVNGDIRTNSNISWNRGSGHLTGLNLTGEYEIVSNESGYQSITMVSRNNSMCFLTHVWVEDTEEDQEYAQCEITDDGTNWILWAKANGAGTMDAYAYCQARCLQW